ncbi:PAS domain S-box-containing protein [Halanaerobium sp. DL-01]|uniref:PAS domain S-box protein n=1 Tax=Halanaerobium sp. DL-01 TaxID=1653064 RepID=UPI000DF206F7|nr:PAS domain S-box protein [Halanaerobium sp. DL-01]RCW82539.1 PAS domain S-box-containing protein [Halanaerobium sp. DL-01]
MIKKDYNKKIPVKIQDKWQNIVNILVRTAGSTDALITRFEPPFLDVFKAGDNIENIFKEGMRTKLSGHYCEAVIKNEKKVMIVNALENSKWKDSIDAQAGINAYLGYPLKWADGKIFGTLCIYDKKTHHFSENTQEIMLQFKELIESHLEIIDKNIEIKRANEIIKKKNDKYDDTVNKAPIGIFETTSNGKVISINKTMAEIIGFSSIDDTLKHYNDLKKDLYLNQKRREEFIKILNKNGEVKNFEYQAIGKNEIHKWISMNARKSRIKEDGTYVIEGFAFDVTERKKREEQIREQKEELSAAFEQLTAYNEEVIAMNEELEQSFEEINLLNQRFVNMIELVSNMEDKTLLSEKEFFADLLKSAVEIIPEADYGKICIINRQDKCKFVDAVGHDIKILEKITFDHELLIDEGNKSVNNTKNYFFDIDRMELDKKESLLKALKPIKDSLYINIVIEGQIVGRIGLDIKKESSRNFSETSKKVLKSFSSLASSFFAFKRFDNLQTNFTKELITSIIKIMEMYDLYTKGHSENVAKIAAAIAKEMNLSKQTIRNTYWAGLVHDIGKLLIPLDIINKTEKLTDQEYELIKKHPVWGSKALSSSEILKPIAKYLLHHHERWDGRGYPEGLKENEIPLISQILGVADAWDAMLSKRAYRNSLSFEKALMEIKRNRGSQFSPQVADTFIRIIEDDEINQLEVKVLNNEINNSKNRNYILTRKEEYEKLFEKSEEGIVIVDHSFSIIKANNYFLDMFGYDRKKIIGENIKKIVPEDKTKETDNYIHRLIQGEDINSETVRKKENGELINVSIQAFPINLNGSNMGYYIIYRDINELKETKRKYENIKGRYKALFENDNTIMLIIDPDNGEIVDANPAAVNFYGWSKDKLTSMKISDINVLNKEEVKKEMEEARNKNKNYFNFKHRTVNEEAKDVEVYSQPIPFEEKEYLYSIIHEKK